MSAIGPTKRMHDESAPYGGGGDGGGGDGGGEGGGGDGGGGDGGGDGGGEGGGGDGGGDGGMLACSCRRIADSELGCSAQRISSTAVHDSGSLPRRNAENCSARFAEFTSCEGDDPLFGLPVSGRLSIRRSWLSGRARGRATSFVASCAAELLAAASAASTRVAMAGRQKSAAAGARGSEVWGDFKLRDRVE